MNSTKPSYIDNKMLFSEKDLEQLKSDGIDINDVLLQLYYFEKGFPNTKISDPCAAGNGIKICNSNEKQYFIKLFDDEKDMRITKFIPASGAASRMFKHLHSLLLDEKKSGINPNDLKLSEDFLVNFKKFAFWNELAESLNKKGLNADDLLEKHQFNILIKELLENEGLNYSNIPKGLVSFHTYQHQVRNAFEEHLFESVDYTAGNKSMTVHFTVAEDYKNTIETEVAGYLKNLGKITAKKIDVEFSIQKKSTNTIAVDLQNNLLRDELGKLIFRPAGHGALIENLNELDAELVFIKNIDNIIIDHLKKPTIEYKKLLAGYLIDTKNKVFQYLKMLDKDCNENQLLEIRNFANNHLHLSIGEKANREEIIKQLNKPIRICGMVKNQGEPGGGPFWTEDMNGVTSLQVVEASQIDHKNIEQVTLLKKATHFNPVDLVCWIKNWQGKKFNLLNYRDMNTGFISKKSINGVDCKAIELPGLWNGAMAYWITLFVEVPIETFNPVKTVNDLLRPAHQS